MKIAINGFGRIGRAAFKIILERKDRGEDIDIVAINDLGVVENMGYLLKYDSVYGVYEKSVSFENDSLIVDNKPYKILQIKEPENLPWKDLNIDVVLECTGLFTSKDGAYKHITAGSKKVIISAPAKDNEIKTYVLGSYDFDVNEDVISNASCTTNSITPVLSVIERDFGIEKAMLTTIHAYTASQAIVDSPNKKDMREGRAGAVNIIPTSTGAAKATAKALTSLENKFDGISVRVPVVCGSLSDLTILTKKDTTVDEINQSLQNASKEPLYKGILKFTMLPLVSTDILRSPYSAIVDGEMTRVVDKNLVKIMAWYDNEWGYSNRLVDMAIVYCKI